MHPQSEAMVRPFRLRFVTGGGWDPEGARW